MFSSSRPYEKHQPSESAREFSKNFFEKSPKAYQSGLGKRVKVLEGGNEIALITERKEFGKRAGIAIPHVEYNVHCGQLVIIMLRNTSHVTNLSN